MTSDDGTPFFDRHRDLNGEIRHKHGDASVRALRRAYGGWFARGFRSTDTLDEVLDTLDERSLFQLMKDHEAGQLDEKLRLASRLE